MRKMDAEPLIRKAALVAIVFNQSCEILEKKVALSAQVLSRDDVFVGVRQVRSVPVIERIGHRLCCIVVWPTLRRGPFALNLLRK